MDAREAAYEEHKHRQSKNIYRLPSIVEGELAESTQIGDIMSSSPSSSITHILQSYAEETTQNLRSLRTKRETTKGESSVCIDRSTIIRWIL
jgi:hypothetical protein